MLFDGTRKRTWGCFSGGRAEVLRPEKFVPASFLALYNFIQNASLSSEIPMNIRKSFLENKVKSKNNIVYLSWNSTVVDTATTSQISKTPSLIFWNFPCKTALVFLFPWKTQVLNVKIHKHSANLLDLHIFCSARRERPPSQLEPCAGWKGLSAPAP